MIPGRGRRVSLLEVLIQILKRQLLLLLLLHSLLRNQGRRGRGLRAQTMSRLQSPERSVVAGRGRRVELHRGRKGP